MKTFFEMYNLIRSKKLIREQDMGMGGGMPPMGGPGGGMPSMGGPGGGMPSMGGPGGGMPFMGGPGGGNHRKALDWPGYGQRSWDALVNAPLECDGRTLAEALKLANTKRRSSKVILFDKWLASPFRPSSSILDATLSLYGNHDVAAIQEHAAPKEQIRCATEEIRKVIGLSLKKEEYRVIFLSGAPGAGKTLVGLDLVMRGEHASDSCIS